MRCPRTSSTGHKRASSFASFASQQSQSTVVRHRQPFVGHFVIAPHLAVADAPAVGGRVLLNPSQTGPGHQEPHDIIHAAFDRRLVRTGHGSTSEKADACIPCSFGIPADSTKFADRRKQRFAGEAPIEQNRYRGEWHLNLRNLPTVHVFGCPGLKRPRLPQR